MKYYFVNYFFKVGDMMQFQPTAEVIADKHPFELMAEYEQRLKDYELRLGSWQQITKEEYELYKKLNI